MPTPVRPARVVLADDDCLFRASLRQLLEAPPSVIADVYGVDVAPGFEVVAEVADGDETVRVLQTVDADLVLLDLCLPVMSGIAALAQLPRDLAPRVVLLAGAVTRPELADAIRLGVRGLVLKTAAADVLFEAIRWVREGRYWLDYSLMTDLIETVRPLLAAAPRAARDGSRRLTRREREVLELLVAGYANKEIADVSSVTEDSVKHHLTRIYSKLGVSNRVELATLATEHRLLEQ